MKIAILDDYFGRAHSFADWSAADFAQVDFITDHIADQTTLIETLKPYHAIGIMRERTAFPADVLSQLPELQLIVTTGKQNAAIDLSAATKLGITVCGTSSPGHATAELAFLMIMNLVRRFVPLSQDLSQQGIWQAQMGADLRGKTLGILGLGRLGSQVAALGQAIGMEVIAWSENLSQADCEAKQVRYVTKSGLFSEADVVSVHLRLSARTQHLVAATELQALGPTGYLVNTSRAEIIEHSALIHALDHGVIAGLATDVFPVEPATSADGLIGHPRVLATPHIGYCTEETFAVFYTEMLQAFCAFHQGQPIRVLT